MTKAVEFLTDDAPRHGADGYLHESAVYVERLTGRTAVFPHILIMRREVNYLEAVVALMSAE